jgi:hypothetical protein
MAERDSIEGRAAPASAQVHKNAALILNDREHLHLFDLLEAAVETLDGNTDSDRPRACIRAALDFLLKKERTPEDHTVPTPGAATGPRPTSQAEKQAVEGWASTNWIEGPAVIVDPAAQPLALVSWAYGQIKQCVMLMQVIGCSTADLQIEPSEVCGAFRHPLEQALTVLEAAGHKLLAQGGERA